MMLSLGLFFSITFLVSWTCWIAGARVGDWGTAPLLGSALTYVGVFAPSFVAMALTARESGMQGVSRLVMAIAHVDVPYWSWLFAAFYVIATDAPVID